MKRRVLTTVLAIVMCLLLLPGAAMATEKNETFTYTFGSISPVKDGEFFIAIFDPSGRLVANAYPNSNGIYDLEYLDVSKTYTYTIYAGGYEPYSGIITAAQPYGEDIVLTKIESNVTYSIIGDTLTISGTGPIPDYGTWSHAPWNPTTGIKHIVVESGITRIGDRALVLAVGGGSEVETISIPNTVTSIGEVALGFHPYLTELEIPADVTSIGNRAFDRCKNLTLTFRGSAPSFGEEVFYRTTDVIVRYPAAEPSWNAVVANSDEPVIWQPYGPVGGLAVKASPLSSPANGKVSINITEADGCDIFSDYDIYYRVVSRKPSAPEVGTYVGNDDTWKLYLDHTSTALPIAQTVDAQDGSYIEAVAVSSDFTAVYWGASLAINDGYNSGSSGGSSSGSIIVTPKPNKEWQKEDEKSTLSIVFSDVSSGDYYADAVSWAVKKGITNGVGDNKFAPNASCTRGQMVTFLYRMAGEPAVSGSVNFSDVAADSYYVDAIAWAVAKGITNGTGDGLFAPDAKCSRAQMATFLFRMAGGSNAGDSGFADVDEGAYYADAIAWAVANGITNGVGSGKFAPDVECTRGQMVTLLYRCFAEQ